MILDILSNQIADASFSCAIHKINLENKVQDIYMDRVWGLEIYNPFSVNFCFAVYENRRVYRFAILVSDLEKTEEKPTTFQDLIDIYNGTTKNEINEYLYSEAVLSSKEWNNPIINILSKINLLKKPDRSLPEDLLTLKHDGINYT